MAFPSFWEKTDVASPDWWVKIMVNNSALVCISGKLLTSNNSQLLEDNKPVRTGFNFPRISIGRPDQSGRNKNALFGDPFLQYKRMHTVSELTSLADQFLQIIASCTI